jgi:hypothetical protein
MMRMSPVLLLFPGPAAQGQPAPDLVVPGVFAAAEAPGTGFWAFTPFSSRQQVLIDPSELAPARLRQIWGISVRRNMGDPAACIGGRLHLEVWISHSPLTAASASATLALNRGADHRRVFAGLVTLPAVGAAPTSPAPWAAPWAVALPFGLPFPYAGGTLCIESVTTVPVDQDPPLQLPWWPIDARVLPAAGRVALNGQSCITGMPGQPAGVDPAGLTPGGSATLWLRGPRRAFPALCIVGLDDRWLGSLPLPLDLGPLGAPGCVLWNDWWFVTATLVSPLPSASFSHGCVALRLPLEPTLVGQVFYAQWAAVDPPRNALGLSFSNGVAATIGALPTGGDVGWLESTDLASDQGRRLTGRAPVLCLHLARM